MINIKKIKPMATSIVTTMHKYAVDEVDSSGLITDTHKMAGTLKEMQKVVAVGPMVRGIEVGDLVCINPSNYAIRKFKENSLKGDIMENSEVGYKFNVIELDFVPHLLLTDRDILYVVEEWEDVEDSTIVLPDNTLLQDTPNIFN